jgi:hypothetical protein
LLDIRRTSRRVAESNDRRWRISDGALAAASLRWRFWLRNPLLELLPLPRDLVGVPVELRSKIIELRPQQVAFFVGGHVFPALGPGSGPPPRSRGAATEIVAQAYLSTAAGAQAMRVKHVLTLRLKVPSENREAHRIPKLGHRQSQATSQPRNQHRHPHATSAGSRRRFGTATGN